MAGALCPSPGVRSTYAACSGAPDSARRRRRLPAGRRRASPATLKWILDGSGGPELVGPAPSADGKALDPNNEWGHDVLWWLDRMVRTQRPLVEKMTLFWHDHFATREGETPRMLAQNRLLRKHALGKFPALLEGVTRDPAMQLFLSLADSSKEAPNENYARELMELFTLGKGYTEKDIREAARALTGFRARWNDGFRGIYYDRTRHDRGVEEDPRQEGPPRLARRAEDRLRAPQPRAVHHRQALGLLHHPAARRAHAQEARRHLQEVRQADQAGGRADPRAPGALPRPRQPGHGQVADRVPGRRAALAEGRRVPARVVVAARPDGSGAVPAAAAWPGGTGGRRGSPRTR